MYQCKLHWGWGGQFHEETEFHVLDKGEIPAVLKKKMVGIARRLSFDCGRLEYPLHPWIGSLEVIPVVNRETFHMDDFGLENFMDNEIKYTQELIEGDNLFIEGNYNLNVAPENLEGWK